MLPSGVMRGTQAIVVVILVATVAIPALATLTRISNNPQIAIRSGQTKKWWENAVIYQIYPRSFKDSDGDGVGDLNGITSKLEHLKDIGVDAVWLSPIYPSPQADFGYDISNFTDIDPQYGTLEDFKNLKKRSKELGLKLILDFVPNHSSDQHVWFNKSVQRIPPYTDYYVWRKGKQVDGKLMPPNNWISNFRKSAWEWNEKRQEYYLHQFVKEQPDLNYANHGLVYEMKEALKFWLNLGVDGFRVDAIPCLFETGFEDEPLSHQTDDPEDYQYLDHIYTQDQPQTYDMVSQWRKVLDDHSKETIMMTESYSSIEKVMQYYGTKQKPGAHFPFNFNMITSLHRNSTAQEFKKVIDSWLNRMDDEVKKPNWVTGNHDKNRVAGDVRFGPELADGIVMLALTLPGTAITYNGEEIGMEDTFIRWEETLDPWAKNKGEDYLTVSRDPQRTPFQWDSTTSAGFSTNPKTWLPVNPNYYRLNLAAQKQAKHSHYHIYKALVQARKQPSMQGDHEVQVVDNILVVKRSTAGEDTFYLAVNLNSHEIQWKLPISQNFTVWTASMNSQLRPNDTVSEAVSLRPKAAVLLTTGKVPPAF